MPVSFIRLSWNRKNAAKRSEAMKTVTGCDFSMAEDKNSERALRRVDMECEICLYEAGKLAVEEILMYVIENELDEKEKTAVKLKWFNGMKTSLIAKETGLTPDGVRKALKRGKMKIYNSMKYVAMYNSIIDGRKQLPKDFHIKIINCVNGKELIS